MRTWTVPWQLETLLVVGALAVVVVLVAPTLGQPLVEAHDFRQTQTAYTARIFHEQGIDLFHPTLPVLGEPFEIPFEFPLFQALASLVMDLGIDDDVALRLTGLVFFLTTALLLYGLVRHVAGRLSAFASLVVFVVSPLGLLWGRTSMIEYLATAGSVGFAWSTIAWRENRRPLPGALALVAGLVAMLVKPTTALFWILPGVAYRPPGRASNASNRASVLWTGALVVIPLLATVLWTRHADAVKASSPATEWLTSTKLEEWNFGTLEQRLDPYIWGVVSDRVANLLVGPMLVLLPVAIVAVVRSRQRLFWLAIAFAAFAPPFVFTNLYFVHDYYLAAVSPALAALVGLSVGYLWSVLPKRPIVVALAVTLGVLALAGLPYHSRGYWLRIYEPVHDPTAVLPLAREVEALTSPDTLVAITGRDWGPAVLYYAHRRGHMVPDNDRDLAYDLIRDEGYRFLVVSDPNDNSIEFLSRWKWVGVLGAHTYAIGNMPKDVSRSLLVATHETGTLKGWPAQGQRLLAGTVRIPCGAPVRIPAGDSGTWIRFARSVPEGRIRVGYDLAPLPARRVIFAAPALAERGRLPILCAGAESLEIVDAIDSQGPA